MLFGDPDVEESLRVLFCEGQEPGPIRHRCRDGHDTIVISGQLGEFDAEDVLILGW